MLFWDNLFVVVVIATDGSPRRLGASGSGRRGSATQGPHGGSLFSARQHRTDFKKGTRHGLNRKQGDKMAALTDFWKSL
jgi:hypothetical protein